MRSLPSLPFVYPGLGIPSYLLVGLSACLLVGLAAPADASRPRPPKQCTEIEETIQLRDDLKQAVRCNNELMMFGSSDDCGVVPPACSGPLMNDALTLAYGAIETTPGPTGPGTGPQINCQQQLGQAVWHYAWGRLHRRVLGDSPEAADQAFSFVTDEIETKCQVDVVLDATGTKLPRVGPSCASAVGAPGTPVDAAALARCTHDLLERWAEKRAPQPELPRPNIIFIMTDDQRWDMVGPEHAPPGEVIMPSVLSELAAQGVTFDNAFAPTPLCSPSRASVLTGQYGTNHTVYGTNSSVNGAPNLDDTSTLATWLDSAGYRTGHFGKYLNGWGILWQNGVPYHPPGWDVWTTFRSSDYYDFSLVEDGQLVNYPGTQEYSTDLLRDKAIEFIDESVAGTEPFYLHLVPVAPHAPFQPAPRHASLFAGLDPFQPLSLNEADVSDKPWYFENLAFQDEAQLEIWRKGMLRTLQAVDEAVAAIVQRLRDHGILDETMIVFTSDHGYLLGEHRLLAKFKPYEEATRIPLIIRYPEVAPLPRNEDRLVGTIDFASTFAELAGAELTHVPDGDSLVGTLEGTTAPWRNHIYTEGWPGGREWLSVHDGNWVYTEHAKGTTPPTVRAPELYDLVNDPLQLENLAEDPAHALRVQQMKALFPQFRPFWPTDMLNP